MRLGSLLKEFESDCNEWYRYQERGRCAWRARIKVWRTLVRRHGLARTFRHRHTIRQVLLRKELAYARGLDYDMLIKASQSLRGAWHAVRPSVISRWCIMWILICLLARAVATGHGLWVLGTMLIISILAALFVLILRSRNEE